MRFLLLLTVAITFVLAGCSDNSKITKNKATTKVSNGKSKPVAIEEKEYSEDNPPSVLFPAISAQPQTKADLVPKGWTIEKESLGDLNGDGVPDIMLVLHMTDPRNIVKNNGMGVSQLNTNPRMLVVGFGNAQTKNYVLALANHTLISRHLNPSMDDPFANAVILNGTLQVSLHLWMSSGSWSTSENKFTFRYQNGGFNLIGYDSSDTMRNSGETTTISINYLSKKEVITKGNTENNHKTVSVKAIRTATPPSIDAVGDGLDYNPEN